MRIRSLGDATLLLELESRIDPGVNAAVLAASEHIRAERLEGVRDVVPAYASLAVHYDPLHTDVRALRVLVDEAAAASRGGAPGQSSEPVEIPVCYGGEFGPDLTGVAGWARCSSDEAIAMHTAATYRVYMLGFQPGFPYMAAVDPRIAMPRLDTPRARVAAGSVGIAGSQTGIYPFASPGGWQIVGRTPISLFSLDRDPPARLSAGSHVRFRAIDAGEFERLSTTGSVR
jgi:KipI family sensor histidine kinase inhibitor